MIFYQNGYKIILEERNKTIDYSVTVIGPEFEEIEITGNMPRPIIYGQESYVTKIREENGISTETRYFVRTNEYKDFPAGTVEDTELFSNYAPTQQGIVLQKVEVNEK